MVMNKFYDKNTVLLLTLTFNCSYKKETVGNFCYKLSSLNLISKKMSLKL
jgi:hypothetical protein